MLELRKPDAAIKYFYITLCPAYC